MASPPRGPEHNPRSGASAESDRLLDAEAGSGGALSPRARLARSNSHISTKEVTATTTRSRRRSIAVSCDAVYIMNCPCVLV